jgi:NMD protein affecting ribosome stability and mRNA decay
MTPTATAIEDPDRCYACGRNPAAISGLCVDCLGRSVWNLGLHWREQP